MTVKTPSAMSSNKSYLVKAYYDWISDNDLTPYIVVDINVYGVLVPMNYVADGQIVLNIASSAVGTIALGAFAIELSARFGGKLEHISVPYGAIAAIYAKENGVGTSLPIEHSSEDSLIAPDDPIKVDTPSHKKPSLSSVDTAGATKEKSAKAKSKVSLTIIK